MKRRPEEDHGSLDSLMDTLCNVVGILVIMLVVTQLSVNQTVKKISTSEQVDPDALAKAEAELDRARRQKAELEERLSSFDYDPQETRVQLAAVQRAIIDNRADLRVLEQQQSEKQAAAAEQTTAAQELIDEQEQGREKLQEQTRQALEQLAKLEARLEDTPAPAVLPAKVVHLPDPRPAPKDAQPVTFFCWGEHLLAANLEELRDNARKRFAFIVTRYNLDRNPAAGLDAEEIIERFNAAPIRDKFFDVELVARGARPYLRLTPHMNAAESATGIAHGNSDFQSRLRKVKADGDYARFLVWPDSFEIYLAARQIAESMGVMAGWQLIRDRDDYLYFIGGGQYRFGPPPQPDTNPPAQPAPSEPKPPPPVDEID